MSKKQQLILERQLRKCKRELDKLIKMKVFNEIDIPRPDVMKKIGDKLGELIILLNHNRL